MLDDRPPECAVMVDVNCRPRVVADRSRYLDRMGRVFAHADVVKVSDEDLAYLHPVADPLTAGRAILDRGAQAVLVTAGADAVHVLTGAGELAVPVPHVAVVDTIGAGDSFSGGLLAWWSQTGRTVDQLGDVDHLAAAVGVTRFEVREHGALYATVTLPNVIVGTVGGGTGLPTQRACLDILGLAGPGHARAFAEVAAALALAGELSIIGALSAGHFTRAHELLARRPPSS